MTLKGELVPDLYAADAGRAGGGIFLFMMMNAQQAGGGNSKMMNFGKSRAKMTLGDKGVSHSLGVADSEEEKEELEEIVDFLKEPGKYTGVRPESPKPVGGLGTSKTLLAKAVAGQPVPFSASPDLISWKCSSVWALPVCADLFEGKKQSIMHLVSVFIDEIDAVARRRGTGMGGGHDEEKSRP